ncbi:TPA: hypothetical protein SMQ21_000731 [Proteus mirabilis]|nr:hypothetical protein [Proteus mirabilis]HEK1077754.1 hypothetical protein [Proteus mirabilis]HEK2105446.1 hypothetical protein [Proteus mirabilis]
MPTLPLIPLFNNDYHAPNGTIVTNEYDAAMYMAEYQLDNGIDNHIESMLKGSQNYPKWVNAMENYSLTNARELIKYKTCYPEFDLTKVEQELSHFNALPSTGQKLFHGGYWNHQSNVVTLQEPFSTTFSPQVALRELDHLGIGAKNPTIQIWVLTVVNPKTNVYFYDINNNDNLGYEYELLFAPGATLTLINTHTTNFIYTAYSGTWPKQTAHKKTVEILEVNIS